MNVALYGAGGSHWTMTERRRNAVQRTSNTLAIGPSSLSWDGQALSISIAEITAPLPSAVRGQVRIFPIAVTDRTVSLDREGRHRWQPIAPSARVEVALDSPALHWSGMGYVDSNHGDVPLERDFARWTWSRASVSDGTAVIYDVDRRGGERLSLALHFDRHGTAHPFSPPLEVRLPRTAWRLERTTRADEGHGAMVIRSLEDGPFYARSAISTWLHGEPAVGVHEALSLDRFSKRWVQALLPFRMPRAWR